MTTSYLLKNNLGNMIIAQSGLINETECKGSVYLEISILIPSDQYNCVTTGVNTQYFLYKLILVSGKYQSYCSLNSVDERGEIFVQDNSVSYDADGLCRWFNQLLGVPMPGHFCYSYSL